MSELGDILERVFEPRFACVSARVTVSIDREGQRRMFERRNMVVAVASTGAVDAPLPTTFTSVDDIWLHQDGRFRIEGYGLRVFGDRAGQVMLRPDQVAVRVSGSHLSGLPSSVVFEPAVLLWGYRLEVGGTESVAGRVGDLVRCRLRHDDAPFWPGPLNRWFPPTETVELVFDRATGVLLRLAATEAGAVGSSIVVSNLAFDDEVDLAAFELPAGLHVRTEAEDLRERMIAEGVDVSTLDPDDLEGMQRAFFDHHRAQTGFLPPDRRARHQPTGPPPDDEEAARAEIVEAFEHIDDRDGNGGAVNVHGGGNLGPSLDQAAERFPGEKRSTVDEVLFLDDHQAIVWFGVTVENGPSAGSEGRAVLIDGRWMVARETMGALLSMAGINVPSPV